MRQDRSRHLIVELEVWLREQRTKLSRNNNDQSDQLAASMMTDGFACRTMLPSVSCVWSPWGETGLSPGPMRAARLLLPSTALSPLPNSMTPTRRFGLPTGWRTKSGLTMTQLAVLADDYSASIVTLGAVAVGGSSTGNIQLLGDNDWFKVSLIAGVTYQFDLKGSDTGDGTLAQTYIELRNSTGALLLSDLGSGPGGPGPGYNSRLTFTAAASGVYFLASSSAGDLGTYNISVNVVSTTPIDDFAASTSTQGTISSGHSVTGTIETTNDADWFKIALIKGTTYQFDLEGAHTKKAPSSRRPPSNYIAQPGYSLFLMMVKASVRKVPVPERTPAYSMLRLKPAPTSSRLTPLQTALVLIP